MRTVLALVSIGLLGLGAGAAGQSPAPATVPAGTVAPGTAPGGQGGAPAETRSERGPVQVLVRVDPDKVRIGDPVNLTIEVTAEAGVELLMPEFGSALERFSIVEFVPRESIDADGRTVALQHYRLQAPVSGEHSIPPITIEFVDRRPGQRPAPDDEDAYELLTERLRFTVESVVPAGAGADLRPPAEPLEPLRSATAKPLPWAIAGAIFLALLLIGGLAWRRSRRAGPPLSAFQVAIARLDVLQGQSRPQDSPAMDAFFVELSSVVRRYLEARFALHAPELTTEEFLDVAAVSPDLTRENRGFLQDFLRRADRVKFAGHMPAPADVEAVLVAVDSFLRQTGAGSDPSVQSGADVGGGSGGGSGGGAEGPGKPGWQGGDGSGAQEPSLTPPASADPAAAGSRHA